MRINLNQKWRKISVDVHLKIVKKHCVYKKRYTQNSITSACKTDKYLKSIFDDSVIGCGKTIDVVAKQYGNASETVSINFNEKKSTYKMDYC